MNTANNGDPPMLILGLCLFIAVTICSSAGTAFNELTSVQNVPPFLCAFWRLFLQNIVQFIPFIISLRKVWIEDEEKRAVEVWKNGREGGLSFDLNFDVEAEKFRNENNLTVDADEPFETKRLLNDNMKKYSSNNSERGGSDGDHNNENDRVAMTKEELMIPKYLKSMPLLCLSGFALGTHFSMWVYSLRRTSITHSLLWVSMGPIVLNFSSWALFIISTFLATCSISSIGPFRKPSLLETLGAVMGIAGAIIMLIDTARIGTKESSYDQNRSHSPSISGDVAAFTGAVAVCVYLVIGKKLRSWLPIWLYMFPVIGFASLTCLTYALLDNHDKTTWQGMTNSSVFGLFALRYLPFVLYLGIGPGIFGHTMLSALLKYISPLIVSTAMLSEPIMGSIIGHLFGMQAMPQMYTWIGGIVLMIGLVLVVIGESD